MSPGDLLNDTACVAEPNELTGLFWAIMKGIANTALFIFFLILWAMV